MKNINYLPFSLFAYLTMRWSVEPVFIVHIQKVHTYETDQTHDVSENRLKLLRTIDYSTTNTVYVYALRRKHDGWGDGVNVERTNSWFVVDFVKP